MDSASHPGYLPASLAPLPSVFNRWHLIVLMAVWFPLNPWVLYDLLNPNMSSIPPLVGSFALAGLTALGPFAVAAIEGGPTYVRQAWILFAFCAPPLLAAFVAQLLWRPTSRVAQFARVTAWGAGWFVWFCGGFISIGGRMG